MAQNFLKCRRMKVPEVDKPLKNTKKSKKSKKTSNLPKYVVKDPIYTIGQEWYMSLLHYYNVRATSVSESPQGADLSKIVEQMNNVVIVGIPITKDENPTLIALVVAKCFEVAAEVDDILQTCRFPANNGDNSPRIIVTLSSDLTRTKWLKSYTEFKKKNGTLTAKYLHESFTENEMSIEHFLTAQFSKLLRKVQNYAHYAGYEKVFIRYGNIMLQKDQESQPVCITSPEDIKRERTQSYRRVDCRPSNYAVVVCNRPKLESTNQNSGIMGRFPRETVQQPRNQSAGESKPINRSVSAINTKTGSECTNLNLLGNNPTPNHCAGMLQLNGTTESEPITLAAATSNATPIAANDLTIENHGINSIVSYERDCETASDLINLAEIERLNRTTESKDIKLTVSARGTTASNQMEDTLKIKSCFNYIRKAEPEPKNQEAQVDQLEIAVGENALKIAVSGNDLDHVASEKSKNDIVNGIQHEEVNTIKKALPGKHAKTLEFGKVKILQRVSKLKPLSDETQMPQPKEKQGNVKECGSNAVKSAELASHLNDRKSKNPGIALNGIQKGGADTIIVALPTTQQESEILEVIQRVSKPKQLSDNAQEAQLKNAVGENGVESVKNAVKNAAVAASAIQREFGASNAAVNEGETNAIMKSVLTTDSGTVDVKDQSVAKTKKKVAPARHQTQLEATQYPSFVLKNPIYEYGRKWYIMHFLDDTLPCVKTSLDIDEIINLQTKVVISGIPITKGEELFLIVKVVAKFFKLKVFPKDVVHVYRLPPKKGDIVPGIVVIFESIKIRTKWLNTFVNCERFLVAKQLHKCFPQREITIRPFPK